MTDKSGIFIKKPVSASDLVRLQGRWVITSLPEISKQIDEALKTRQVNHWDASGLERLDTAAAMMLLEHDVKLENLKPEHQTVIDLLQKNKKEKAAAEKPQHSDFYYGVEKIGKAVVDIYREAIDLIAFIGQTFMALVRCVLHPSRFRFDSVARHIKETGVHALPIVSLMAFLISIVLAYQGAAQLRRFGAEIFTINMLAISLLREMGVLLTAIMVAGRSGSAFTAEIGVMKVNEEVDAMRVMGIDPFEVLVVPRFIGLLIALPILALTANIMGALGGAIISWTLLDIQLAQYIQQFKVSITAATFWVGISKAPVFALIISVVGCMRGMEVTGSAESVGRLTTVSVVHSIFLVLLADALFSILFTKLGI